MRSPFRLLALAGLSCMSVASMAWIDTGHMLVAFIAEKHLKPGVMAECERLLAIGADDRNADFVTTAPWADDIRGQRRETGPWHYIDLHFRSDGKPTPNKPDAENVVWAIHKFSTILKDRSLPDADRSEALRFLIHFVGDIHQPLHATSRDSDDRPNGDKGGNDFRIQTPPDFSGISRPPRNLHALWDFGGGLFMGMRRPLSSEARKTIESQAESLMQSHPERSMRDVNDMRPEDWAQESFKLDKTVVYNLTENTIPSPAYMEKAREVSADRISLAGYRLANLLNGLLKQ